MPSLFRATTPHGEGSVALHSFPSGKVVATCDPSDLDTDTEDSFDFVAAFINEEMIIASMIESGRHVHIHADGLRGQGIISYPTTGGTGYPVVCQNSSRDWTKGAWRASHGEQCLSYSFCWAPYARRSEPAPTSR
jgi:hypothetical protein